MPVINISVENKIAEADGTLYVCGNSDFVAKFAFDAEWEAYETKTARFGYNNSYVDVVFTGNKCPVPIISGTYFFNIGVYAGNLHTTTPARVPCKKSILCDTGFPADPPNDIYNQIMAKLNSLGSADPEAIAKAVADYLAAHPIEETDPTVPEWAKAETKPTYTADEVGAISQDDLQTATNNALAQAKASGEFDGPAGAPGKDGAGMDITGATIGQIAKITAVDASGVPTAWSPVGGIFEDSAVDTESPDWNNFKNFSGYNPSTAPIPQEVNGELRAGMLTATGRGRWNTMQQTVLSSKGEPLNMSETGFVDGGHVFEGWDASHTYRLTALIGKYAQGRAHIFTFKPQASGVETFGQVWIGSDHQYKGLEIQPTFAQMWGNFVCQTFSGPNNYGSAKYYGGTAGADRGKADGAHIEITAPHNTTPDRVRILNSSGLVLPVLESDPINAEDGLTWINSTDKKLKCVIAGETVVIGGGTA